MFARYRIVLAKRGFEIQVADSIHFFDLETKRTTQIRS
jgi:hypothetical protein